MPKWLQGVFVPTLMLWLYAACVAVAAAAAPDDRLPPGADYASGLAFSLILASWVLADARKRRSQLCYDYGSFVFFAWPVVVPVYLFRTRGPWAFLTLLCFAGIWLSTILATLATFIIREFAQ